jgi:hypothetical protein
MFRPATISMREYASASETSPATSANQRSPGRTFSRLCPKIEPYKSSLVRYFESAVPEMAASSL